MDMLFYQLENEIPAKLCFWFESIDQVLQDMVPPKKHLLRHQPANAQIGLMEGNTFCTTLQPRLFTMDLNVMEHKVFYTEVSILQDAALYLYYFYHNPGKKRHVFI